MFPIKTLLHLILAKIMAVGMVLGFTCKVWRQSKVVFALEESTVFSLEKRVLYHTIISHSCCLGNFPFFGV